MTAPARVLRTALLLPLLAALAACGRAEGGERLTVFAAASLREAVTELAEQHRERTGVETVLSFGSSGTLAVQVEHGAPADVLVSAGEDEVERLERAGLVVEGSRTALLSNQLVVVVPAGRGPLSGPRDLLALERIALASPDGVPAGRYARLWLEQLGLWDELAERVLPCVDVRAALAAVEHGGADAGIVYRTDAAITDGVEVAWTVPAGEGPVVRYPAVLLAGGPRESAARAFLAFLSSPGARAVFERHGFVPLDAP